MNNAKWKTRIGAELETLEGKELAPHDIARRSDLLALLMLLHNQNWKQMVHFINHCIQRLEDEEALSLEVMQFLVERLADAWTIANASPKARNNPIASTLCLSGRPSKDQEHLQIAITICEESFNYRHKPDAINHAIGSMALEVKVDTAKRILKKWKPYAMAHIAGLTKDPRKRDYFRKQLSPAERRSLLVGQ